MDDRTETTTAGQAPHFVDVHVGHRVRMRRKFLGISQSDLAVAVGLTFQQIQKYEKGSNRISASKLYDISQLLKVSAAYFFEGLDDLQAEDSFSRPEITARDFLQTAEGVQLAEAFPRIVSPRMRRQMLVIVRAMAGED